MTQTLRCAACFRDKPISEFGKRTFGLKVLIDDVCIKCRLMGREKIVILKHAGGRPVKSLPLNQIQELYNQGYGVKRIASILREQGYEVSHTTIARRLLEMSNKSL